MNLLIQFNNFEKGDKFRVTMSTELKNEIVEIVEILEDGYFILKVNNIIINEPIHSTILFKAEYIRN